MSAAAALTIDDLGEAVGGIPSGREEGLLLPLQALRRALSEAGALGEVPLEEEVEVACHCTGVTFADLRAIAPQEVSRLNLQRRTAIGTGCGTCLMAIHNYLDELEG